MISTDATPTARPDDDTGSVAVALNPQTARFNMLATITILQALMIADPAFTISYGFGRRSSYNQYRPALEDMSVERGTS